VEARILRIAPRLRDIVQLAHERNCATNSVADDLARAAIAAAHARAA
jgi:hypothetical protein